MDKVFTYEEAVEIRRKYLELEEQLPEIIFAAKKTRTVVQIAKDLRFNRTNIYYLLNRRG